MTQLTLGETVAIARELKGWSQARLERESRVNRSLISQIETGKVINPGFGTVVRLCRALGIKIQRLAEAYELPGIGDIDEFPEETTR